LDRQKQRWLSASGDDVGSTLDTSHPRRCGRGCPMTVMLQRPWVQRVAATASNRC